MKNILLLAVVLALGLVLSNCTQQEKDYSTAKNITVKWELVSNITKEDGVFNAKFIIENNSSFDLTDKWKLFFNMSPRTIVPSETEQPAKVEHINGDWHKLVPAKGFSLKKNETVEIPYSGNYSVFKECEGPQGAYFVFYNNDGSRNKIVEVKCEILPFTREEQTKREKDDIVPVPTPESRYNDNKNVKLITGDKLLKIIPSPVSVKKTEGTVSVDNSWSIVYENGLKNEADYLAEKIKTYTGIELKTSEGALSKNRISLSIGAVKTNDISSEAYNLRTGSNNIRITGSDAAGVFYGVQSLIALIPLDNYKKHNNSIGFERMVIHDAPRFGYRGIQLDIARNFKSEETILRVIDIMSFYKLNKLFLYISDDEGWRLEIPGLPELTKVGGQREHAASIKDPVVHPAYGSGPYAYGKNSHGSGFITREGFIKLLKYADARHIEVIPGINFPGHSRAAIKSMEARYNRLMAEGKEKEANEYRLIDPDDKSVYSSAQLYKDNVVSIAVESTYRFSKKVIDEIALMYKDAGLKMKDIHTGGDEVPKGAWTASPLAEKVLKDNPDIKDAANLQAYFFNRFLKNLGNRDYRIHGWEEVSLLKNNDGSYSINPEFVDENIIPHVWNNIFEYGNMDLAYRIANAGYKLVLCPASNFYLDNAYTKDPLEPGATWAGFTNSKNTWTFAPFDFYKTTTHTMMGHEIKESEYDNMEKLKPGAEKNILGLQAQLWSEAIKDRSTLEYQMFPKMFGFIECTWAKQRNWETVNNKAEREKEINRGWNIFANTLAQKELPRLSYIDGGFNYRIPLPGAIIKDGKLYANIAFPGLELRFTTDGSEPTVNSTKYTEPVKVTGSIKIRAFDSTGKGSRTITVN